MQFGFESGHVSVLENEELVGYDLEPWKEVENHYPVDCLEYLKTGGFEFELNENYHPKTVHLIQAVGRCFIVLGSGRLEPIFPDQKRLLQVINGEGNATNFVEKDFLDIWTKHPELS